MARTHRKKHSPAPNPAHLVNVKYEMSQLLGSLQRIGSETDPIIKNALLESALIHVRGLLEFLWLERKPPYLRAADFGYSAQTPLPRRLFSRVSAEIAHLTTNRRVGELPPRPWTEADVAPIIAEYQTFQKFIDNQATTQHEPITFVSFSASTV